jgi:signal transduction histidine kinase
MQALRERPFLRPPSALTLYHAGVAAAAIVGLAHLAANRPWGSHDLELVFWLGVLASSELLPVPGWGNTQLTISLPFHMALIFLYGPEAAALVAFVASLDPREFRGEITLFNALFNRAQTALSVLIAGVVFYSFATIDSDLPRLIAGAFAAALAFEFANATFVAVHLGLARDLPLKHVYRELAGASVVEFLFFYVGLGLLGIPLARMYIEIPSGEWVIVFFLLPLLLARQMFARSQALERASADLKSRERVLRQLSNRMAEERYDERKQIAAYLHDDLAQMLFRLGLQADTVRSQFEKGNLDKAYVALDNVEEIKDDSVKLVRGLIRDLDRSPIGRAGLATALNTLASDLSKDGSIRFQVDVTEMELPAPIQLLAYQIGREAAQNAVKHAGPKNIWITLDVEGGDVILRIRDDGSGFDPSQGSPEGHYGLSIMRERAQLAGGTLNIASRTDVGSEVTVRFRSSWLQEEQARPPRDEQEPAAS